MTRKLAECGTEAAFRRHHRYGQRPCEACRTAHADYERARYQGAALKRRAA